MAKFISRARWKQARKQRKAGNSAEVYRITYLSLDYLYETI